MIEELCEYLQRLGWAEDIAIKTHDAYYDDGLVGAEKACAEIWKDELMDAIRAWRREVGED